MYMNDYITVTIVIIHFMQLPESPRSPAEFVLQSTLISSITA